MTSMGTVSSANASPSGLVTTPRFVRTSIPRSARRCVAIAHGPRSPGGMSGIDCSTWARSTAASSEESGATMDGSDVIPANLRYDSQVSKGQSTEGETTRCFTF
jgi:hypothetical protein